MVEKCKGNEKLAVVGFLITILGMGCFFFGGLFSMTAITIIIKDAKPIIVFVSGIVMILLGMYLIHD